MDACWIYVTAWLFSKVALRGVSDFPVPSPPILILLELGGWGLMVYLLDRTALPIGVVRMVMGAVGLVVCGAVALAYSPFDAATYSIVWIVVLLYAGLVGLGLWFLGGNRATERITFEDIYVDFRLGLIAISGSVLFSTMVASERINELWSELGSVGIWFFVFGLVGLALGNRESVRRETGNAGMKSWGWMVSASVGVILLVGLLGQAFGGKDIFSTLQGLLLDALKVLGLIVYGIIYVLLWPLTLLGLDIQPMERVVTPTPTPSPDFAGKALEEARKNYLQIGPLKMPIELQTLFMTIAALLVLAAVLYALSRWLRRTRPDREHTEEEERAGFGSWSLLMAQLRRWLNRLLARFRKSPAGGVPERDELAEMRGDPGMAGTLSVRQIYARLLRLAGTVGYPRASYQTPVEYMRFLSSALPNIRSELGDITAAYMDARYGPMPASPEVVQSATLAWRRAETVLEEVRSQRLEVRG
jgi:hypothetical protein